jgi:hypothetical protein
MKTLEVLLMHAREMISTHPDVRGNVNDSLIRCIEECYSCAQTCIACADACLAEDMVQQLRQCIRLNSDCADTCIATGALASRRTGSNEATLKQMLDTCATACRTCAEECERHASKHQHCRVCAEECRRCVTACEQASGSIQPKQALNA